LPPEDALDLVPAWCAAEVIDHHFQQLRDSKWVKFVLIYFFFEVLLAVADGNSFLPLE
jgi:hypothetical protein